VGLPVEMGLLLAYKKGLLMGKAKNKGFFKIFKSWKPCYNIFEILFQADDKFFRVIEKRSSKCVSHKDVRVPLELC
jgi:hypothetical protein